VYSNADKRFLPDRYVVGICPLCNYEQARGDQCENCTHVLDPTDLREPRSAISGSADVEVRESTHLFLKQTLFEQDLRVWIAAHEDAWPILVTSIALKWLDEGLRDRGITRDLSWGIPVNAADWGANPAGKLPSVDLLRDKVFYVWFDAPIAYIATSQDWSAAQATLKSDHIAHSEHTDWRHWWRCELARDVTYVQFMGKDNVPFHTVGFPCTILGVNAHEPPDLRWKLADRIKGFNWLNYYGGKFSTSQQNGIFMDAALELLPAAYWRWYLIANAPESSDSSFTWEHFQGIVNKDLADVLGNFVNRVHKFAETRFDGIVPVSDPWGENETTLVSTLEELLRSYSEQLEQMQFRRAAASLRAIWVTGNEYFNSAAPWARYKTSQSEAAISIQVGLNLVRLFAILSAPIIPTVSEQMLAGLGLETTHDWPSDVSSALRALKPGHPVRPPDILFRKIEDAQVDIWKARFGGSEGV